MGYARHYKLRPWDGKTHDPGITEHNNPQRVKKHDDQRVDQVSDQKIYDQISTWINADSDVAQDLHFTKVSVNLLKQNQDMYVEIGKAVAEKAERRLMKYTQESMNEMWSIIREERCLILSNLWYQIGLQENQVQPYRKAIAICDIIWQRFSQSYQLKERYHDPELNDIQTLMIACKRKSFRMIALILAKEKKFDAAHAELSKFSRWLERIPMWLIFRAEARAEVIKRLGLRGQSAVDEQMWQTELDALLFINKGFIDCAAKCYQLNIKLASSSGESSILYANTLKDYGVFLLHYRNEFDRGFKFLFKFVQIAIESNALHEAFKSLLLVIDESTKVADADLFVSTIDTVWDRIQRLAEKRFEDAVEFRDYIPQTFLLSANHVEKLNGRAEDALRFTSIAEGLLDKRTDDKANDLRQLVRRLNRRLRLRMVS